MSDVLHGANTLQTFCRNNGISIPTAYREIAANDSRPARLVGGLSSRAKQRVVGSTAFLAW
jgi:hypothetical protein